MKLSIGALSLLAGSFFILLTDSYKFTHWKMLRDKTENVSSYFEARVGARYPKTVWVGLQAILKKYFTGVIVTKEEVELAAQLCALHFGDESYFNREGWMYIVNHHGGKLPLVIKAVAEGSVIPVGNVMMYVEATDEKCAWLTNYVETMLTHVWFPCTVATRSYYLKQTIQKYADICGTENIDFHVHDFGFRGTSSLESAEIGGLAHLVNFKGTDTFPGILGAIKYYDGDPENIGFSVAATEHSVATPFKLDERKYILEMMEEFPNGILSLVGDSNSIIDFVIKGMASCKEEIIQRWKNGKAFINRIVVRPDSPRWDGDTPYEQVLWIQEELGKIFGYTVNDKGYKVLHPAVGVIYGDGLSEEEIDQIYFHLVKNGWAIDTDISGQGGGLLQKLNRDTQRFAFKCCGQVIDGEWEDIWKQPLDASKASKKGRLKLIKNYSLDGSWYYETINHHHPLYHDFQDEMVEVYRNGEMVKTWTFDEVRENAKS